MTLVAVQVLLKWNMQRGVPVIPKATSREHLAENLVGMCDWRLSNQHKVSVGFLQGLCVCICGVVWPAKLH